MNLPRALFILLVVAALAQVAWYYPQLPERMATHFGAYGRPNDWSDKLGFFIGYIIIILLNCLIFLWAPISISRIRSNRFSLPNRDYWLAPERRDETIRYLRHQLLWFGVVHMLLGLYVVQLVIAANQLKSPILSGDIIWALTTYGIILVTWLIRLIGHFINIGSDLGDYSNH